MTVVLKVWVATQTWVLKTLGMGRAKVIQIRQNNFLQDQNFQNLQNVFSFCLLSSSKFLHHTHLVGFISIK